jgi:predicted MFS family arabinose efflux permease
MSVMPTSAVPLSVTPVTIARAVETAPPFRYAPLYWMAVGSFAIGTEGFMVAAVLPSMSSDLAVSVAVAGQLMTIFALTYAFSSPLLTALTGGFDRRNLLIAAMTVFAAGNIVAAMAPNYSSLAAARVLLAMAAGLYVPGANALAGVLVPPNRRGGALAIVSGGMSMAVALGVPLGALVGAHFGWRMMFIGVAVLSVIALAGLLVGLPRGIGSGIAVASLRQRLAVARQPAVLRALLVTALWAAGAYTVYAYIASYLTTTAGFAGSHISFALFMWGGAAFAGVLIGGFATDRFGHGRIIATTLPLVAIALFSLSLSAKLLSPAQAIAPVLIALALWGVSAWAFSPAQQTRLIGIAGLEGASIAISLNASFMYFGFSMGAVLGALVLGFGTVSDLGWVGGLMELAAFAISAVIGLFGRPLPTAAAETI